MATKSTCPACGAEFEHPDDQATVYCDFCGTELRLFEEDGVNQLRVVSQPEPQKDILTEQAHRQLSEEPDAQPEGKPVAPGYASSGSAMADPGAWSDPAVLPETPVTADTIPEVPLFQTGSQPVSVAGTGKTGRWIAIGVAVFIVLCILLACIVAAFLIPVIGSVG